MIAVQLSFDLGNVVWKNNGEQVTEHPVLYIGSRYSVLKDEVNLWLRRNCQGSYKFGYNQRTYELRFDLQDDATLFVLRWL